MREAYLKDFERNSHGGVLMNDKRDTQRQSVMKAGTILFDGSGIAAWFVTCRMVAQILKSKAKPEFRVHSNF